MEKFRLTNTEQKVANAISKVIVVEVAIVFYIARLFVKSTYKLKRHLFRLAVVILLFNSALTTLHTIVYAPYANAGEFQYIQKPQTEHEKIVNEIYTVFGKDAPDAFKILSCENHALNPNAQNYNSDGSIDIGIFQVNSVHKVNPVYLYDWRTNISIAYHIFKDSGWGAWTCSRTLGI